MSGQTVASAPAPLRPRRAAPNAASTPAWARGGTWVAMTAPVAPGNPTPLSAAVVAVVAGAAVAGAVGSAEASAVNGNEAGGEQEVSRHICTLTLPLTWAPVPAAFGSSGARHTTVPSCSSTWSPFQAGTSVIVRTWGGASGTKGADGSHADAASTPIRVAFGPPGFCVRA